MRAPREELPSPQPVGLPSPERLTWQSATKVPEADVRYWVGNLWSAEGEARLVAANHLSNHTVGLSFDPYGGALYVLLAIRINDEPDFYAHPYVGYLKSMAVKDSHYLAMTVAARGDGDDGVTITVPYHRFQ